ncbi:phosphoenolpyruvate carboxylase 2 [Artemisia annua]|uniref:Phosphoenolpyruvate carboxylase 2 n=1 Tax=Artemisia annua TaxID=35608 RepID=A0A2U1M4T1_ARTAN|nr:phosphoenolpyruvate carboxylase 2 [Artemisia annua]
MNRDIWIRDCLSQLYVKDTTPDDKQELGEDFDRDIQAAFRTGEIRRAPPTLYDEMRAGMSYFHVTIFICRVATIIKKIGINERAPYNGSVIPFLPKSNHDHHIP